MGNIILTASRKAFDTFISIGISILFWSGIFQIAIDSSLVKNIGKFFYKPLTILFPSLKKDDLCFDLICGNIICNLLGLGASAAPLGLKAFKCLHEKNNNKDAPSDEMIMLIGLNTSSLTLFPTSILTIRAMFKGTSDLYLIVNMLIASLVATVFTITSILLFRKLKGNTT